MLIKTLFRQKSFIINISFWVWFEKLRKILKFIIQEYVTKKNMLFFEASAKTAESVNVAFVSLAKKLMSKR